MNRKMTVIFFCLFLVIVLSIPYISAHAVSAPEDSTSTSDTIKNPPQDTQDTSAQDGGTIDSTQSSEINTSETETPDDSNHETPSSDITPAEDNNNTTPSEIDNIPPAPADENTAPQAPANGNTKPSTPSKGSTKPAVPPKGSSKPAAPAKTNSKTTTPEKANNKPAVPAATNKTSPSKGNNKSTPDKKSPAVKPKTETKQMTKASCESFINSKNLKSKSDYLLWVSTNTQKVHVFSKSDDGWLLHKSFICTVGKDSTPTIKGVFTTQAKVYFAFDKKYNCYLKYVTRIFRGYLFHSVILNKDGKVIDGTLGKKKSHGCVRLSLKDSEWLYSTVPLGTTIFIN